MKILLACSAGMSTSMLMERVKKHMQDNSLDGEVVALSVTEAKEKLKDYDVVLVGPQVRFELGRLKQIAEPWGVPVADIPPAIYAGMKGDVVYELAYGLAKNANPKI